MLSSIFKIKKNKKNTFKVEVPSSTYFFTQRATASLYEPPHFIDEYGGLPTQEKYIINWLDCQLLSAINGKDKKQSELTDKQRLHEDLKIAGISCDESKTDYNKFDGYSVCCTQSTFNKFKNLLAPYYQRILSIDIKIFISMLQKIEAVIKNEGSIATKDGGWTLYKPSQEHVDLQTPLRLQIIAAVFNALVTAKKDKDCYSHIYYALNNIKIPAEYIKLSHYLEALKQTLNQSCKQPKQLVFKR